MSNNVHFPKPKCDQFEDAMVKALKSTKERFRRQQKQSFAQTDQENVIQGNIEDKLSFIKRMKILNKSQENKKCYNYESDNETGTKTNGISFSYNEVIDEMNDWQTY